MAMTREDYVASIKSAFVTTATRLANAYLVAQVPWLAHPIVQPFISYTLDRIFDGIADQAEINAFFLYIDMRGVAQGKAFGEAARNLKTARDSKNATAIHQAEQDVIETLRALISMSN